MTFTEIETKSFSNIYCKDASIACVKVQLPSAILLPYHRSYLIGTVTVNGVVNTGSAPKSRSA